MLTSRGKSNFSVLEETNLVRDGEVPLLHFQLRKIPPPLDPLTVVDLASLAM